MMKNTVGWLERVNSFVSTDIEQETDSVFKPRLWVQDQILQLSLLHLHSWLTTLSLLIKQQKSGSDDN